MSTQDNNAAMAPDMQADQAQPQVPDTDQVLSDADEDEDIFSSDDYIEEDAPDFAVERFRRLINTENFSDYDMRLWYAFHQATKDAPIEDITVPTLMGNKNLFDTFKEIIRCVQRFGTHPYYPLDDTGIAKLFANAFQYKLRFVLERKQWYHYDGKKWGPDDEKAMEYCKALTQELKQYASTDEVYSRNDIGKRINTLANKWLTRRGRETILKDAASIYPLSLSEFDTHENLLNCLDGTLDLNTITYREHRAEDFLSKMANVKYDEKAKCSLWEKHIDEVMLHDKEMIKYLQQALGYALTGYTNYECFFILYGATSRNGKGVTMETFKTLMGDYGRSASPETITQKKSVNSSGPSEDIARLAGARFVNISEPDENMVLSSALVKTLTGNDTVVARYLHQNSFEYTPTYKIFINTNYRPTVTDKTVFLSGRIKIIPFNRHFEPHEQVKDLKDELTKDESLSGILNWCLAGWELLKKRENFVEPAAIKATIKEYEQDSAAMIQPREPSKAVYCQLRDKVARFIDEILEANPSSEVFSMDVHTEYCKWCKANGFVSESYRAFKSEMSFYTTITKKRPADNSSPSSRMMILGYKFKQKI